MLLALFLLICAAFFPVQLFLCFRYRKWKIKLIPSFLILVFMAGCLITALPGLHLIPEDWRLAALIMLFIGCYVLAADALAWMIWGVVKLIQKRRK